VRPGAYCHVHQQRQVRRRCISKPPESTLPAVIDARSIRMLPRRVRARGHRRHRHSVVVDVAGEGASGCEGDEAGHQTRIESPARSRPLRDPLRCPAAGVPLSTCTRSPAARRRTTRPKRASCREQRFSGNDPWAHAMAAFVERLHLGRCGRPADAARPPAQRARSRRRNRSWSISSRFAAPLWLVPSRPPPGRAGNSSIFRTCLCFRHHPRGARGYRSIEHVTALHGDGIRHRSRKLGNINGLAILAKTLGNDIERGTTTFRPSYTRSRSAHRRARSRRIVRSRAEDRHSQCGGAARS
jgi:hypothetical protein